ncbi:hypothetical protein C8T65DRAFT_755346 [Cerioporus squamosus]|nr:hypothetical protein C8T65DRAFT_755346 [Cerioporus squamosus]
MDRPLIPQPSHYAVIRIDPEAMVKDLGLEDSETLREVRGMSRKKYLVFLVWPEELPMPDMRWCRYLVDPIGTALRQPDEAQGITSDMVIPIAPNKCYTGGRRPVYPTPTFPFSNCYHWVLNSMTVRVRVHQDGVAHDGAFKLPPAESHALNEGFFPDCQRIEDDIASPVDLQKEIEEINSIMTRGLARLALAQKTPKQIQEEHPVSNSRPPAGPGELTDYYWVKTLNDLWRELRAQYVNSPSSCDPPFPILVIPRSLDADDVPLRPRLSAEYSIPPSSSSLPNDDAVPLPDTVTATATKKSRGSLAAIAPQSSTPLRGITNAAHPQPLPQRRHVSRASMVYHRLRAKFVNFLHHGRASEVH